jgi:hypothetical protein
MIKRKNHLLVAISLAIVTATLAAFIQNGHDNLGGTTAPQLETSWRAIVTPIGPPIVLVCPTNDILPLVKQLKSVKPQATGLACFIL